MVTIFYAARQLKQARPNRASTEKDLQDYILNWKKSWRTEEKESALANSIRDLVALGWLQLEMSEFTSEEVF